MNCCKTLVCDSNVTEKNILQALQHRCRPTEGGFLYIRPAHCSAWIELPTGQRPRTEAPHAPGAGGIYVIPAQCVPPDGTAKPATTNGPRSAFDRTPVSPDSELHDHLTRLCRIIEQRIANVVERLQIIGLPRLDGGQRTRNAESQ